MDEILEERKKRIDDCIRFRHTSRVPHMANFYGWVFLQYKPDLYDVMYDYKEMEKAFDAFAEHYAFDAHADLGTRNYFPVAKAVNGGFLFHRINKNHDAVELDDHCLLETEEYPEFAEDINAFKWKKLAPRIFGENLTEERLRNVAREIQRFREFTAHMRESVGSKHHQLVRRIADFPIGYEHIFQYWRGIKNTSIDLRRNTKLLDNAVRALDASFGNEDENFAGYEKILQAPRHPHAMADVGFNLLGHSILNKKQFEKYEWPYLKKGAELAQKYNKTIFVFCEAEILRFAEYLEQIPKGVMMLCIEQDDIFEVRRRLPNLALCGGMPVDLLGRGTPQQCVDYAKKLIDELGDGFMLSQNKMISYKNDCKRENLEALCEFVSNYSI